MKRILALLLAVIMVLPIMSVNVFADDIASYYEKVTLPVDELEEGTYLFVDLFDGKNRFVKPESIEYNNRIGFEAVETDLAGRSSITASLAEYEWTLTKTDSGKWLIGANGKFIKFTSTSSKGITATLENVGDEFTIELDSTKNKYKLSVGNCGLNANSTRPLFNGYNDKPTSLTLYKKTEKPNVPAIEGYYEKTTSPVSELEEGTYLFVDLFNGKNRFVKPEAIEYNNRIGFEAVETDLAGGNSMTGSLAEYEWTLTKTDSGKWLIGANGKFIKFTSTDSKGITATLEDVGDEFTIELNSTKDKYKLSVGSCGLNANSTRPLFNGYNNQPTSLTFYKKTEKTEEVPRTYPITVVACSDFQHKKGNTEGAAFVSDILNRIQVDNPQVDAFFCAGDYDYDLTFSQTDTESGITALSSALRDVFGKKVHEVYIEGNHDAHTSDLLARSGNNDPEDSLYGIFVINEDDYMWGSNASNSGSHPGMSAEAIVNQTAANLQAYLDAKIADGFTRPIFVISHLPLHYNMRTKYDGDGMYANYLFDVMNEAAENGLNIIYLFGHDHSNGWDDYLGGSVIYLEKGSNINIAQASKSNFKAETLNFTYMNAGYVGYYDNHNGGEDTLTMSVFTVTEDSVVVSRYTKDGVYQLKSEGVYNSYKSENSSHYPVDRTVVPSPQTIVLNKDITAPVKYTDEETGISVTAKASNMTVAEIEDELFSADGYKSVKLYEVTGESLIGTARIDVPVGSVIADNCKIFILSSDSKYVEVVPTFSNGTASFKIDSFTKFAVCELKPESGYYKQTVSPDELEEGTYVIVFDSRLMKPVSVSKDNGSGARQGFDLVSSNDVNVNVIKNKKLSAYEWTLTKTEDGKWLLSSQAGYAKFAEVDGVGGISAILTDKENAGVFTLQKAGDSYTFSSTYNDKTYVFNYNSRGIINGYGSSPASLLLYKKVVVEDPGNTKPVGPAMKNVGVNGFIYVNEDYHALIINGHLVVYPHEVLDTERCKICCDVKR